MHPSLTHGAISWAELMSADPVGVNAFYARLFGWDHQVVPMPQGDYHLQTLAGRPLAGVMNTEDEMSSFWVFYVTVDDVDEAHTRALALGATSACDPMDVPTVGRMAGFFDPQGAFISVIRYEPMEDGAPASDPDFIDGFGTPGSFSWYHLSTPDQASARAFYAELFGWDIRVDQMPDGPYDTIMVAGVGIGGIIPPASPTDRAHWTAFVTVKDVDATLAAAVESGGTVVVPGWDIPGVGRIAEIADPTGATLWVATYASPG